MRNIFLLGHDVCVVLGTHIEKAQAHMILSSVVMPKYVYSYILPHTHDSLEVCLSDSCRPGPQCLWKGSFDLADLVVHRFEFSKPFFGTGVWGFNAIWLPHELPTIIILLNKKQSK